VQGSGVEPDRRRQQGAGEQRGEGSGGRCGAALGHQRSRRLFHMPELYSGLQRDPTNFPVQYIGANVPQACAPGSCFALRQMLVGFQPDAPGGKLYIDPVLPGWLPKLTIRDLHVGEHVFDLRFWRDDGATRFETLKGDPAAVAQKCYATGMTRWL